MKEFAYGTKYSYQITENGRYTGNTVIINTDHRANTKGFKAEVAEIASATGCRFVRYRKNDKYVYNEWKYIKK